MLVVAVSTKTLFSRNVIATPIIGYLIIRFNNKETLPSIESFSFVFVLNYWFRPQLVKPTYCKLGIYIYLNYIFNSLENH